jgi:hypothetical protein
MFTKQIPLITISCTSRQTGVVVKHKRGEIQMTNKEKYQALTKQIEGVFGLGFTDECVDAENCSIANDGSEEFWANMLSCLNDSAGSRLVEAGFNPADAGVKY